MKKLVVLTIVAAVLAIPAVAQAAYESGSCTSGSASISFSNANFVSGLGWYNGSGRTISFSGSCSGCSLGPIIYGWASSPLVEYYMGRGGGSSAGSYSSCGGSCTLYTNSCNGPNLTGDGPFSQYNCSCGGSGTNMGCHFDAWSSLGKGISSQDYQVVALEGWSSNSGSGTLSVSGSDWYTHWTGSGSATFTCGGGTTTTSGGSTTTTSGGSGNFEAENYSSQSGTSNVSADGGTAVQYSSSSSYTAYNIDFGSSGPSSISVRGYYSGSGMSIRFYLDSQYGTNFCTIYQSGYGSWFTSSNSCYPKPTGTHTVYVKVSSANGQINWFDIPGATGGGGTTTTTAGSTTTTSGGGANNIVVRARSTDGSGHIYCTVGGGQIGNWTLGTSMSNYSASTNNSGGVNVCFDNDTGGRDVEVDYITVNSQTRQSEDQNYNTGVWQDSSCGGSYSEWLHCNGCIGYGDVGGGGSTTTTSQATTTTTSGATTTTTAGWWWTTTTSGATTSTTTTSQATTTTTTSGGGGCDCGTCNWYGTPIPMCCESCSGWGWYDGGCQRSCVCQSSCDSQ